ncbi:hypothetical protein ZWY2020_051410 [Hordeum vulgare]|nr:hypothetical protein ZWY2020_051410 [Hordeum vulgare]
MGRTAARGSRRGMAADSEQPAAGSPPPPPAGQAVDPAEQAPERGAVPEEGQAQGRRQPPQEPRLGQGLLHQRRLRTLGKPDKAPGVAFASSKTPRATAKAPPVTVLVNAASDKASCFNKQWVRWW